MERSIASAIGINDFKRLNINLLLDELEHSNRGIKKVSVYFTSAPSEKVKCIIEAVVKIPGKKKKLLMKKARGSSQTAALRKAIKRVHEKIDNIKRKQIRKGAIAA